MQRRRNDREGSPNRLTEEAGALALVALLLTASAGCSAGGGGDEEEDEGLVVPSVVTFTMGTSAPLTLEYGGADIDVNAKLGGFYSINVDEWRNDAATTLTLETGALFGSLVVTVLDPVVGPAWAHPRAGVIEVRQVSTSDLILVGVNGAGDGVEIYFDESGDGIGILGPFAHSWEELFELLDSSPTEYEEIAAFSWAALELARNRFLIVFETFTAIFELVDFLEDIGPGANVEIADGCQSLPGSGTFGDGFFRWHDVDGDGLVDDGDAFTAVLANCWVDTPGPLDPLFDGTLELTGFNYAETPFATGADIEFVDLRTRVTEESGGVYTVLPSGETTVRGDTGVLFE